MTQQTEKTKCILCLESFPDVHHSVVSDSLPLQVCRACWGKHIEAFPEPIKKKLTDKDLAFWVRFFKGVRQIAVESIVSDQKNADGSRSTLENDQKEPSPPESPIEPPSHSTEPSPTAALMEEPPPQAPPDPAAILEGRLAEAQAEYRECLKQELDAWDRQKQEMKKGRISEAIENEIEGYKRKVSESERTVAQLEAEINALRNPSASPTADPPMDAAGGEKTGENGKSEKKTSFLKSLFK